MAMLLERQHEKIWDLGAELALEETSARFNACTGKAGSLSGTVQVLLRHEGGSPSGSFSLVKAEVKSL